MRAMASQVTSLTIVYSSVYSGADQWTYQSSASLAFVWGIHRWPVNSPHKWPVTRKMFPYDNVIMCKCIPLMTLHTTPPLLNVTWTPLSTFSYLFILHFVCNLELSNVFKMCYPVNVKSVNMSHILEHMLDNYNDSNGTQDPILNSQTTSRTSPSRSY